MKSLALLKKSASAMSETERNNYQNLSVSRIKTFETCAKQYKFQYIEKLPKKEWDFHVFGKALHSVLEFFYKNLHQGLPWHELMKESFLSSLKEYENKLTNSQIKELKDILTIYLFKLAEQKKTNALPTICGIEREFNLLIDDQILFNGFIDLDQIDPDNVHHVIDYKTTKNKKYLSDRFQLLIYAFILCLNFPEIEKVRTSFLLFRHNCELLTEEYTRNELMKLEEKILAYADKIKKEKLYRPTPNYLCKFCSYLDPKLCPEGWAHINPSLW